MLDGKENKRAILIIVIAILLIVLIIFGLVKFVQSKNDIREKRKEQNSTKIEQVEEK